MNREYQLLSNPLFLSRISAEESKNKQQSEKQILSLDPSIATIITRQESTMSSADTSKVYELYHLLRQR